MSDLPTLYVPKETAERSPGTSIIACVALPYFKNDIAYVPAARLDAAHLEIATLNEALGVAMTRLRLRAADGDEGCAATIRVIERELTPKEPSDEV